MPTPIARNSSVLLLENGPDALAVRIAMATAAKQSLDLQYYLWHHDSAGCLLAYHVLAAADRGVRVRLLLDDVDTGGMDEILAAFNAHPYISVRLFNPFRNRWLRPLEILTRFRELNRRMHNKAMCCDRRVCVVGGRNIGSAYFGLSAWERENDAANTETPAFDDIDLLASGAAADDTSALFDQYWECPLSVASHTLFGTAAGRVLPDTLRRTLANVAERTTGAMASLRASPTEPLTDWLVRCVPAELRLLADPPDKSWTRRKRKFTLASQLGRALDAATREVWIVSPYFVPRRGVQEQLGGLRRRGVSVHVLTNSQASNDVLAVHAGYAPKRRGLLRAGVELREFQPNAAQLRASGKAKIHFSPSHGRSSLHAKIYIIDRQRCFIGSFNLDPRSARLNTEMGFMVDCPQIANLAIKYAESLASTAYRLSLESPETPLSPILWSSPNDQQYTRDPHTGWAARMLVRLLAFFPIEAQL